MSPCRCRAALARAFVPCLLGIAVGPVSAQIPPENDFVADPAFGSAGRASFGVSGLPSFGHRVIAAGTGYWIVGVATTDPEPSITLSRLGTNGVPVAGFGSNGHRLTGIAGQPIGSSFVDSAGRLIVAVRTGLPPRDILVRFLPNGDPDPAFTCCTIQELVFDIAPADNNGIYVSKQRQPPFVNSELIRLTSSGSMDPAYEAFGEAQLTPRVPAAGNLHRDPQGRLWWAPLDAAAIGGTAQTVIRLTGAGALDTTYADNGVAVLHRPCGTSFAGTSNFTVLPGGSAVVIINAGTQSTSTAMVALAGGSSGPRRCDNGNGSLATVNGIATRDAQSFFAASSHCTASGCGPSLRRYRVASDGAVMDDPTFDLDAATQLLSGAFSAVSVDQGKPLTVGTETTDIPERILVVRYGGPNVVFKNGFEE